MTGYRGGGEGEEEEEEEEGEVGGRGRLFWSGGKEEERRESGEGSIAFQLQSPTILFILNQSTTSSSSGTDRQGFKDRHKTVLRLQEPFSLSQQGEWSVSCSFPPILLLLLLLLFLLP